MIEKLFRNIRFSTYLVFLVPSIIGYYLFVRWFQGQFTYPIVNLYDPYPGFPLMPEPYEIPLYLAGYVVIPVVALIVSWIYGNTIGDSVTLFWQQIAIRKRYEKLRVADIVLSIGILACVVSLSVYIFRPNIIHFILSYFERRSVWHLFKLVFTKRLYVVQISFLFAALAFHIAYWKRLSLSCLIEKLEAWRGWKLLTSLLGTALVIVIFHPNFPSQESFTNYVIGPAYDLLHGRALLYETFGLYGILNTYLVALLLKLGLPATFQSMSLVIALAYLVFYFLLYRFLFVWKGSRLFAALGLLASLVLGFFLLTDLYVTPYEYIGQSAFRQGFFIIPLLFLARFLQLRKTIYRELALCASALGVFWNPETGIYMTVAMFIAFGYVEWMRGGRIIQDRMKRVCLRGIHQCAYLIGVFALISCVNAIIYGSFPHWQTLLHILSQFENGFGKTPLPWFGFFEWYVFGYVVFASWFLIQSLKGRSVGGVRIFLLVYGIFSFLYYIGNSAWSYLNFISIPLVVLILDWVYEAIKRGGGDSMNESLSNSDDQPYPVPVSHHLVSAFGCAFVVFFSVLTLAKLPVAFASRNYTQISLLGRQVEFQNLSQDANVLKQTIPEARIPVFHENDGRLLLWAEKTNLFYMTDRGEKLTSMYDDIQVVYQSQVRDLVKQIQDAQPRVVVISTLSDPRFDDLRKGIQEWYEEDRVLQTLVVYRRK